jgi:hypothetical protein
MSSSSADVRTRARIAVTLVLIAEVLAMVLPAVDGTFPDLDGETGRGNALRWEREGVVVAASTVLLVVTVATLLPLWLRPRSSSWLFLFVGTHAAVVGLGWAHRLPVLAGVAAVSAVLVTTLHLVAAGRG